MERGGEVEIHLAERLSQGLGQDKVSTADSFAAGLAERKPAPAPDRLGSDFGCSSDPGYPGACLLASPAPG